MYECYGRCVSCGVLLVELQDNGSFISARNHKCSTRHEAAKRGIHGQNADRAKPQPTFSQRLAYGLQLMRGDNLE